MASPTIILAIEISNPPMIAGGGEVALAHRHADGLVTLIRSRAVSASGRNDDALMPAIERLCTETGVKPSDLSRVAVSAGPGGFTAVRIAVTTAKMIALATGAQLALVPTALVAWRGLGKDIQHSQSVRIVLAWKRQDAWCADFEPDTDPAEPIVASVRTLDEIATDTSRLIVADQKLIDTLASRGVRAESMIAAPLSAATVAQLSAVVAPADPLGAAPIYPREPEAVTKWRELGKSKPSPPTH